MGKDGKAYLLNRDNLGGIGGALAVKQVARGPIITAPAVYPASRRRDGRFRWIRERLPKRNIHTVA